VEALAVDAAPSNGTGVWRYRKWLPVSQVISLGEPVTPLLSVHWNGLDVTFKFEGALPTGSFKDRGAAVLVSWLAEQGVKHVADDSSGNAGAALAAYCARAGIACDIYTPSDASRAKLAQIEIFGARLKLVPGSRARATAALREAAGDEVIYASHAWSPLYLAGTATFAFELWEQLGRKAPDVLVLPVGGGSLLLGAYLGFRALHRAGHIARLPRLVGVQTAACAPLALAAATRSPEPARIDPKPSAAAGILIAEPVRGKEILSAVYATSGTILAVEEAELLTTHRELARIGIFVEPTSVVAVAVLDALGESGVVEPNDQVVVALTGHGLKSPLP
jgi:threonine synthase